MVGEPAAGKKGLVEALRKAMVEIREEEGIKATTQVSETGLLSIAGLGYTYLIPPVSEDDGSKVNVWLVEETQDRNETTLDLLNVALADDKALSSCLVVLVVDLSKPWDALETLTKWASILKTHVERVLQKFPSADPHAKVESFLRRELKRSSSFSSTVSSSGANPADASGEEEPLPLAKGTLTENIGIPLAVVGTKADVISQASEDVETELKLEFVQRHLRQFCLSHGASLTYTASRSDQNCIALGQYLLHRLYPSFYNAPKASLEIQSTRDRVHVPAGLDNVELINILANTQNERLTTWSSDSPFEQVIVDPAKQGAKSREEPKLGLVQDDEELAVPQQTFLSSLFEQQKSLPDAVRVTPTDAAEKALKGFNEVANSMETGIVEVAPNGASSAGGASESEPPSSAAKKTLITKEDVKQDPSLLQNFFQNLLEKSSN